jgi:hypothetical protein
LLYENIVVVFSAARLARGLCCSLCRCAACKKASKRLTFVTPEPRVSPCLWLAGKCCDVRRPYLAGLPTVLRTVTLLGRKLRALGCQTAILSRQFGHPLVVSVPLNTDSLSLCHENENLQFYVLVWHDMSCSVVFCSVLCCAVQCINRLYIFKKDQQMHLDVRM